MIRSPSVPASRRDFAKLGLLAGVVGMAVYVTDCGSSSKSASGGAAPVADTSGAVAGNHGHLATITAAQLTGAADVTLDIKGTADHTHSLTVTAAQLASIKGGGKVVVTTAAGGTDGHTHVVTFTGAAPAPASPSGGGW